MPFFVTPANENNEDDGNNDTSNNTSSDGSCVGGAVVVIATVSWIGKIIFGTIAVYVTAVVVAIVAIATHVDNKIIGI